MTIQFYMQGGIVPAVYSYDMDEDGVLSESDHPLTHRADIIMVVMKRGLVAPTPLQWGTISTIKAINPTWTVEFMFNI